MKKNKTSGIKSFLKGVDIPESVTGDNGTIEIIGDRRVIVEHTKNILSYENESVRLCVGDNYVHIYGSGLTLNSFDDEIMIVDGFIKGVCLE